MSRALPRRAFLAGSAALPLATLAPVAASPKEELTRAPIGSLARAIRDRRVTAKRVVTAYLDRIEAVNPDINAVVTLVAERALEAAGSADRELAAGQLRGTLHGVPITIKDSFDTAGIVTTAGTLGRESYVPETDATVVARLKAAGAILMGKTNTPELTMNFRTDNLIFGKTNNPYDLKLSPGGSSGGAAAAIACGASPLDIGSDTAGSVRVPASYCGIASIKPTIGRVPLTGHVISFGLGLIDPMTQVGPLARFVEDLSVILPIIAGPDGVDPSVAPMPWRDPAGVQLSGLRVARHTENGITSASQEVAAVVESASDALADAGLEVNEARPAALEHSLVLFYKVMGADWGRVSRQLLRAAGTKQHHPSLSRDHRAYTGKEFADVLVQLQNYRLQMHAFMRDYDVILCPVSADATLSHTGPDPLRKMFTYTYNFTGWPAAVVRCGWTESGMPIGVQIVAKPWREDVCLAVAKYLEAQFGGWKPPSAV